MPIERFDVELALKAQRTGEAVFSETAAGLEVVKKAIDRFSEAEANGLSVGEAYKHSLTETKKEALEAGLAYEAQAQFIRDATRALDQFRESEAAGLPFDEAVGVALGGDTVSATGYAAALELVAEGQIGVLAAQEAGMAATEEDVAATEEDEEAKISWMASLWASSVAVWGLAGSLWGSIPGWIQFAVMASAAALALLPFIVALIDATVVVLGWVVAGAGALILLAGLALSFGVVAGILALFASQTQTWANTVQDLHAKWDKVAKVLEGPLRPLIIEISKFIQAMLPIVQSVGLGIEKWFGSALPGVLAGILSVINDLLPDFRTFGDFLANLFVSSGPTIKTFFELMSRGGIAAIEGLLENLVRLTNWFNQESPKWKPIWDGIGTVIQWVAGLWAKLNDWVVANWPSTMTQVHQFLDQIKQGWEKWGPLLMTIIGLITQLIQIGLQAMIDHADILVPAILGIAIAFLAILAAIAILIGAFVTAESAIANFLSNTNDQFVTWANHVIDAINAVIDGINKIPGVHITPIPHLSGDTSGIAAKPTDKAEKQANARLVAANRHAGGSVEAGEIYKIGAYGAEEYFIPNSSGQIASSSPNSNQSSSGTRRMEELLGQVEDHLGAMRNSVPDTDRMEELLEQVEDHLGAMRNSAPGVTAAAAARRNG